MNGNDYREHMKAKAVAYAEDKLSDIKMFMDKDGYHDAVMELANAFLAGADTAVRYARELHDSK